MYKKNCIVCNIPFQSKRKDAVVCSYNCNSKSWRLKNPKEHKIISNRYILKNIIRIRKKNRKWARKNIIKIRKTSKKWATDNPEKHLENSRRWKKLHRIECRKSSKKWIKNNKWYYYATLKNNRKRYKNDLKYKIAIDCRSRLYVALKKNSIKKCKHTFDLIGCSPDFLTRYLKNNYKKLNNMTEKEFIRHSKKFCLEIDHIIPINTFNLLLEREQKRCFHYSNLRFLMRSKNRQRPKDGSDLPKHRMSIYSNKHH